MNDTTPILILLLALWLCVTFILWAAPRALTLTIALVGVVVMFLVECAIQLYGQRQMLRPRFIA